MTQATSASSGMESNQSITNNPQNSTKPDNLPISPPRLATLAIEALSLEKLTQNISQSKGFTQNMDELKDTEKTLKLVLSKIQALKSKGGKLSTVDKHLKFKEHPAVVHYKSSKSACKPPLYVENPENLFRFPNQTPPTTNALHSLIMQLEQTFNLGHTNHKKIEETVLNLLLECHIKQVEFIISSKTHTTEKQALQQSICNDLQDRLHLHFINLVNIEEFISCMYSFRLKIQTETVYKTTRFNTSLYPKNILESKLLGTFISDFVSIHPEFFIKLICHFITTTCQNDLSNQDKVVIKYLLKITSAVLPNIGYSQNPHLEPSLIYQSFYTIVDTLLSNNELLAMEALRALVNIGINPAKCSLSLLLLKALKSEQRLFITLCFKGKMSLMINYEGHILPILHACALRVLQQECSLGTFEWLLELCSPSQFIMQNTNDKNVQDFLSQLLLKERAKPVSPSSSSKINILEQLLECTVSRQLAML